jgi:hypothetical protein
MTISEFAQREEVKKYLIGVKEEDYFDAIYDAMIELIPEEIDDPTASAEQRQGLFCPVIPNPDFFSLDAELKSKWGGR